MKIDSELLYSLKEVYKYIIEQKSPRAFSIISKRVGLNKIEIKKCLIILEKLGVIQGLDVGEDVFNIQGYRKLNLTADFLIDEKGFLLVSENIINEYKERIRELEEEVKKNKEEIEKMKRVLRSYGKGKNYENLIRRARVEHGE